MHACIIVAGRASPTLGLTRCIVTFIEVVYVYTWCRDQNVIKGTGMKLQDNYYRVDTIKSY